MSDANADTLPDPSVASLDTLAAPRSGSSVPDVQLGRGAQLGRYMILDELGAGAMGVVLAAYDPVLDRKVALKLLKSRGRGSDADRLRLQREAQALAKLDHRNVVAVHDVGVHGGQLFVGMEFVEGQTLRAWMTASAQPRPWRDVVTVFIEAGRGLAAAHAAGMVHRDFKPDNVMIGDDGRVRVMDFGLARAQAEVEAGGGLEALREDPAKPLLASPLTRTGTMLGTPAYMALEQFDGRSADARSDQFSFCVALYEALYGERPHAGSSLGQLYLALEAGELRPPPRGVQVPSWLHRVVVRGLAPERSQRWPSIDALLEALAQDPATRRRKWAAAGIIGALMLGGAWGIGAISRANAQACSGMAEPLVGVWDNARREQLRAAFESTGLGYAASTWARVERNLDTYTEAWTAAREQACRASQRAEQSGELLDRRMACLDERLADLRVTVNVLGAANEDVVLRAVETSAGLPDLARCADTRALSAEHPPPEDPALAAQVVRLDAQLIEAAALERAGKLGAGLELAVEAVAEAERLGYEPLQVRAWLTHGSMLNRDGDYEHARSTLDRAYDSAVALKMHEQAARAAVDQIDAVGAGLAEHERGRQWAKHARPLVRADGRDETLARYHDQLGRLAQSEGQLDEALAHFEQMFELRERSLPPEHHELGDALVQLAQLQTNKGAYAQAKLNLERARAIYDQALGPDHPRIGELLSSLGINAERSGNLTQSPRYFEEALTIYEQAYGPDHPRVAKPLNNLGAVSRRMGQHARARAYFERALRLRRAQLGDTHPDVAVLLSNLGKVARSEGDHPTARAKLEEALAIYERAQMGEHPRAAMVLDSLGILARDAGNHERALAYHARSLAINEQVFGPHHSRVARALSNLCFDALRVGELDEAEGYAARSLPIYEAAQDAQSSALAKPLQCLAETQLARGAPQQALHLLERAASLRDIDSLSPQSNAALDFGLARALWDVSPRAGRDRPRAEQLAERAAQSYTEAGERYARELAQVEAWRAERQLVSP